VTDQSQLDDVIVMTQSIIHDAAIMQSMARTAGRVPSIEAVRRLYQSVQVLAMVVKKPVIDIQRDNTKIA